MIDETNITNIDETTNSQNQLTPQTGKKKYCEKCHKQYDASSHVCPFCGHKNKNTVLKVTAGVLIGGTILFGVVPDLNKDKDDSSSSSDRAIVTEAESHTKSNELTTETTKASAIITATEVQTTTKEQISIGKANALRAAENYLDIMPFSYTGIIKQLEYEKYSHEDAVYAADNCGADWKAEAVESAKNYLEILPYSRQELISQLKYEGYTNEEAEYAVQQVGY